MKKCTCTRCNTEFEYTDSDIVNKHDYCSYVICKNLECQNRIYFRNPRDPKDCECK